MGGEVGGDVGGDVGGEVGGVVGVQRGLVMVLVSRVTEPFRANMRPMAVAPVFMVMEVSARMVPRKLVAVPSVAELPTCQKTLQDRAPLVSNTRLLLAVVSVEPTWKTKTAPASSSASRVSVPVSPIEDAEL